MLGLCAYQASVKRGCKAVSESVKSKRSRVSSMQTSACVGECSTSRTDLLFIVLNQKMSHQRYRYMIFGSNGFWRAFGSLRELLVFARGTRV